MGKSNPYEELTPRKAVQVFSGVMLSDGTLSKFTHRGSFFRVALSGEEHIDWLELIRDALDVLGVECFPTTILSRKSPTGKQFTYCELRSRTSLFLAEQRMRWYPKEVKEVPKDFWLTRISLANEFVGDGTSSYSNYNSEYNAAVMLCTESFDLASVKRLEGRLKDLGIMNLSRAHVRPLRSNTSSGIRVRVLGGSIERFFDLVESYIVPSYKYKVKRPGPKACYPSSSYR